MQIQTALEHHQAGRLAQAAALYQDILQREPRHAEALHLLGNIAHQGRDYGAALDLFLRALDVNPANANYYNSLGVTLKAMGSLDDAIACYQQALALRPNFAVAEVSLGNAWQDKGLPEQALLAYEHALAISPDFAEAHFNRGNALRRLERLSEAALSYRAALASRPDYLDALNNLGTVQRALGRLDEATASYRHALAIYPDYVDAHNNLGTVLREQGRLHEAQDSFRQALALQPDSAESHSNLGVVLHELGEWEAAAACYRQALALKPVYPEALNNLGNAQRSLGRLAEAADSYRQAIACWPDYLDAHNNLGITYKELGRADDAISSLTMAAAIQPDSLETLYNLGVMYGEQRRFPEAEHWYRRVLALQPGHVAAHVNLSSVLREVDRLDEARQHRDLAYRQQCVFTTSSATAMRTILLLFDAGKGNVPVKYLFPTRTNNLIDWMIEYAPPGQESTLPYYDVVFNAMGDGDVTGPTLLPVTRFAQVCGKPFLNQPHAVARTARHLMPGLLQGIAGVMTPSLQRVAEDEPLAIDKIGLPALVRPVSTHGGESLTLVESVDALQTAVASLPGAVYVSDFHDFRLADGYYRKYRIIFVDRQPYPYHLAISDHWLVHYATANMLSAPWKLEEERRFLEDPASVFGEAGMVAIRAIGMALDLDYAGMDFTLLADGRLLVFEANATMLVHPEESVAAFKFKNPYIQRIFDAVELLLQRVTGGGTSTPSQ